MAWPSPAQSKEHEYASVDNASEGSDNPLLEANLPARPTKRPLSSLWKNIMWAALLVAAAVFGAFCDRTWGINRDDMAIRHISQYSPVIKDVPITFEIHSFNGTFMPAGNPFRGPAGPETDAAWATMGPDYRAVIIPDSEAEASGLRPDHVRVQQKYGGGYPANVEGLHHLHCLNLLRKSNYWNFDHYKKMGMGPFANDDHILEAHVTHCLDTIRQQLMCQVDVAIFGQVWFNKQAPEPFVDFNTQHKCRNFEAVRQWAEVRQAPEDPPEDYLAPPIEGGKIYDGVP